MTKGELESFIEELKTAGISPGLDTMRDLLHLLGDPQKAVRCVHIAGTNGKGSILAFVSTVLKEAGYKTGRYFSPSLDGEFDNIQIGGRKISAKAVLEGMERIKEADEKLKASGKRGPTLFEAETALAFLYFEKNETDIAVIECGMGGALDATNVITDPLVCAFAHIDMDHSAFLGETMIEIAKTKSGIIKYGADVVSVKQHDGVAKVLAECAKDNGCGFNVAEPYNIRSSPAGQSFDTDEIKKLKIGLLGSFQPDNAAAALKVLQCLEAKGFEIKEKTLREGFEKTEWYGRFSVLGRKPLVIADGAHNPDAAKRLAESIKGYVKEKPVFVMGMLRDKEYDKVLRILSPCMYALVTLTPDNKRALRSEELAAEAAKVCDNITACVSVKEAVETALMLSKIYGGRPVVAAGSLSYLAEFRREYESVTAKGKRK